MWSDESGVAGFFEDLPVLMLVLGGTAMLVSSGVYTSASLGDHRRSERLQEVAARAMDSVVSRIDSLGPGHVPPSLYSIERANLTQQLENSLGDHHFVLSISDLCRPELWRVVCCDGHSGEVCETGSARRLLTAVDDSGVTVILEAKLIVWSG